MFVYHEFEQSNVHVVITKTRENLFVITEVLIFPQEKEGFCDFFVHQTVLK